MINENVLDNSRQRAFINGIGSALPERIVGNAELAQDSNIDDEWIFSRTGIRERRIAGPSETTLSLGVEAANNALSHSGIAAQDIDLILFCTITPDHPLPSAASQLQYRINAANAAAFDIRAACSGFIYGLHIAKAFIASGLATHIVLVCSETLSRITNWQDTQTFPLFADGAGAVVISSKPGIAEIIDTSIHCDGKHDKLLFIPDGGSASPFSNRTLDVQGHAIHMNGKEVFRHALDRMKQSCTELLRANQMQIEDMDLVIPHQSNMRIIDRFAEDLCIPRSKLYMNIAHTGNTGPASVPIALLEAIHQKLLPANASVLSTTFGAGFTWGSALLRFF